MESCNIPVEAHPFEPFLPHGTRLLVLGTFPPKPNRWSMEFYYPNYINDFWRIIGIDFFGDKNRFVDEAHKSFRLDDIKKFLTQQGIGLWDTGTKVRRLKDNASDKFLEIVEPIQLNRVFAAQPSITAIATTGEKAASIIAAQTTSAPPKIGVPVQCDFQGHTFTHWRMPSSSRAYPLSLEKKAAAYRNMFQACGFKVYVPNNS